MARTGPYGLDAEVLARSARGDGRHQVLRLIQGGRPVVLKLYGRKRDRLRDWLRDLGHRLLAGKSGMSPPARLRTERAALELWRRHGFRVPDVLDVALPSEVPSLRLVLEWIDGCRMKEMLADPAVPLDAKRRLLGRCAHEWGRRHELALQLAEPALLHAHASFAHVLVAGEEPVSIDFEVAWRRRDVERLVSLELAGFFDSLARCAPPPQVDALLDAVVAAYPARERLARVAADARGGPYRAFTWLARAARRLTARGRAIGATLGRLDSALARAASTESRGAFRGTKSHP